MTPSTPTRDHPPDPRAPPLPSREAPRPSLAAAALFRRLWDDVADLVGPAATAALVHGALKRASARQPELAAVVLRHEGLEYVWGLPSAWHDPGRGDAVGHLRRMVVEELHPLFRELTGPVIARRLAQAPELVEAGLAGDEAANQAANEVTNEVTQEATQERPVTTRPGIASVLGELAHALESSEDAEARVRRALVLLLRVVPHDRCALVNVAADAAPRVMLEPPLPEPGRLRLAARAEALLGSVAGGASSPEHGSATEPGRSPGLVTVGPSPLAVPLVALDELAGVLVVERDGDPFAEQDLQLLSVVASLLGVYLGSLRLLGEERGVAADLREAMTRRTHFLGMLSHELRNPLGPIGNALHVLDRVPPGSERAEHARTIIARQVGQLTRLVDSLLDATRLASGRVQVERARIDLAAVVERAVQDHAALFARGGVELELRIADRPLWIDGDATRLSQVVGGLLTNAAKFTSPGGRADVSVAREAPGTAVVRVRDDGVGIPAEVRGRLFEPFAQGAETLDRSRGGLGLGLALAKGLVDLHGGTIVARDDDGGRGAELVVTLPLLPEPAPGRAPGPARPRRVLVIDDDVDSAEALRELLALAGHTVERAPDGAEGLRRAVALAPDVILCDIGLPGMSGYDVAKALRAIPGRPHALLIALTGYGSHESCRCALDAGFDAHIVKPVSPDQLLQLVAAAPDAGSGPPGGEAGVFHAAAHPGPAGREALHASHGA